MKPHRPRVLPALSPFASLLRLDHHGDGLHADIGKADVDEALEVVEVRERKHRANEKGRKKG